MELKNPELLTQKEIEELLPKLTDLKDWIKKVEDYALDQAKNGIHYNGFKLVEGRSVAKYKDEKTLIERLEKDGYQKAMFYKIPELISVTDFKRIVKSDYDKYKDLIDKPAGKLTLVPESDKRQEVLINPTAEEEFAEDLKQVDNKKGSQASQADYEDLL